MIAVAEVLDSSPRLRRAIRGLARLLNPLVATVAGRPWLPVLGILHHRGRRSGRWYATPLGMRRSGSGFLVPRTFGDRAEWYLNLVQAEGAVTYLGRRSAVVEAGVVGLAEAGPAFPRYERTLFRLLGIKQFLELRRVD